ncbi:hypothetical protein, partial [Mycolicibacter heraklionensis]|uniref:hypothetical protein n=1 Tax=Mycolicibacter heraklionensis TaxID=512402 RepID=UPI001A95B0C6
GVQFAGCGGKRCDEDIEHVVEIGLSRRGRRGQSQKRGNTDKLAAHNPAAVTRHPDEPFFMEDNRF